MPNILNGALTVGEGRPVNLPFADNELQLLSDLAEEHKLPPESILNMLRLEHGFYRSGRRRGLFPALREIVDLMAADSKGSGSGSDASR